METTTNPVNVHDVTDFIIGQFGDEKDGLTVLKLQKLLYYVQAWHLAFGKGRLFNGGFQAWVHGPVNRDVYDRFKSTHSLFSSLTANDIRDGFDHGLMSQDAKDHIRVVIDAYGELTGMQLEDMTHNEAPWRTARGSLKPFERCETEISELAMTNFYAELLRAEEKATA